LIAKAGKIVFYPYQEGVTGLIRSCIFTGSIVYIVSFYIFIQNGAMPTLFCFEQLHVDCLVYVVKLTILSGCWLILSFMGRYSSISAETYIFFYSSIVFILFLLSAYNLVLLYVCLEGLSVCIFIQMVLCSTTLARTEGLVKYFLVSALSSVFIIGAIAFIYGAFGSVSCTVVGVLCLNPWAVSTYEGIGASAEMGVLLFFVAYFFKLGLPLFHFWVFDVYERISG